jgi:hypothetical protein
MGWYWIVVAATFVAALGPAAYAGPVELDQEQATWNTLVATAYAPTSTSTTLQTFTVGKSGTLNRVDLPVLWYSAVPDWDGDVALDLLATSGGIPQTGTVLGSVIRSTTTLPASSTFAATSAQWTSFDFSSLSIGLSAGDELALQLRAIPDADGFANVYAGLRTADVYSGGAHWRWSMTLPGGTPNLNGGIFNQYDMAFRTYVETSTTIVPLPASAWLGLTLLGSMGLVRRLGRKRRSRG